MNWRSGRTDGEREREYRFKTMPGLRKRQVLRRRVNDRALPLALFTPRSAPEDGFSQREGADTSVLIAVPMYHGGVI